ncbi:MAG: 6-aminohexanoate hydrolase [Micavibrio sp. TMED2]|nr:MAG: 6-aminohexanoate hydrolase [Micavibrio sp. TMED2]|tara:strand:+ start:8655 stop:9719 length:1065 start_codon:yes stop_codon:yes gene_type:complete
MMDSSTATRRTLLQGGSAALLGTMLHFTGLVRSASAQNYTLEQVLENADALTALETVLVAKGGEVVAERGYNGHSATVPTNIKSASKTVMSALVGIAIDRGMLSGTDQPIIEILRDDMPADPDPRLSEITIGHLLSMQAGLQRTSGANYGSWVASSNWVRNALSRPFVDEPGGDMLYSTGSSHLLSAILTKVTGKSTRANALDWFAAVDGFGIGGWDRDPQGIYLGGNQMAMSPRSLLAFGEVYRNHGQAADGTQVVSADWIRQSWTARTRSRYTGDGYGYGWFLGRINGADVRYAWGYGGQMLYVVPDHDLTVVMTSDANPRRTTITHRDDLHQLLGSIITALSGDDKAASRS